MTISLPNLECVPRCIPSVLTAAVPILVVHECHVTPWIRRHRLAVDQDCGLPVISRIRDASLTLDASTCGDLVKRVISAYIGTSRRLVWSHRPGPFRTSRRLGFVVSYSLHIIFTYMYLVLLPLPDIHPVRCSRAPAFFHTQNRAAGTLHRIV
eukprot:COSAG02_NODE_4780_length_4987_cov_6.396072_2_plen_153_part_00